MLMPGVISKGFEKIIKCLSLCKYYLVFIYLEVP